MWTAAHADELKIDATRLIVVGPSAGGGLAAGVALLARDRGYPDLTDRILICPMLDDRLENHSSKMLDGESIWDRNNNLYGWTALLGERRGGPDVSIYAAPARAADLAGLPRTYLDTGSAEVFRDEILIYAARLSEAGVSLDLHMCGGLYAWLRQRSSSCQDLAGIDCGQGRVRPTSARVVGILTQFSPTT